MRRIVPSVSGSIQRRWATLIIGDANNGSKTLRQGQCHVEDIVGLNGHVSSVRANGPLADRLAAGDMLSLVDICAARCATKHIFGRFTMGFADEKSHGGAVTPQEDRKSVVTVSMDHIVFKHPVMMGDKIDLMGTIADVGSSSVAVNVDVCRVQFGSNMKLPVANAKVFMVAVDSHLRPAKVVPALELDEGDAVAMKNYRDAQDAKVSMKRAKTFQQDELDSKSIEELAAKHSALLTRDPTKRAWVTVPSTRHSAHRLFFPSDLNLNNTVFGGELLRWMEAHAVHCGRMFAYNRNIFAIGMHAIAFHEPVYKSDWMKLEAHVLYVRNTTMEVEVVVTAERQGATIRTNRANFVLASLDDAGHPLAIPTGLDLTPVDADHGSWFKKHVLASQRYQWMLAAGRVTPSSPVTRV